MNREEAIAQLSKSERGLDAIRALLPWLDADGIGLDALNQSAVITLLSSAWDRPGSTRDLMRQAICAAQD